MMESELRGIFCARGGKYIYIQSFCWETYGKLLQKSTHKDEG